MPSVFFEWICLQISSDKFLLTLITPNILDISSENLNTSQFVSSLWQGKRWIGPKKLSWLRNMRQWTGLSVEELLQAAADRERSYQITNKKYRQGTERRSITHSLIPMLRESLMENNVLSLQSESDSQNVHVAASDTKEVYHLEKKNKTQLLVSNNKIIRFY